MLEKLLSMFRNDEAPAREDDADSTRTAVAALLVEAARMDEQYTEEEKQLIDKALAAEFSLSPEDAAALRVTGEQAQSDAIDLHRFTKHAKDMGEEEKIVLVENLWRIVLSDGDRDSYEDALIRRICGLIYVDDRASGEARQRVEASLS